MTSKGEANFATPNSPSQLHDLKSLRSEILPVVQRNEDSPLNSQQELKYVKTNGPRRLRLVFTPSSLSAPPQQRIANGNYRRTRRNACERGSMVIAWLEHDADSDVTISVIAYLKTRTIRTRYQRRRYQVEQRKSHLWDIAHVLEMEVCRLAPAVRLLTLSVRFRTEYVDGERAANFFSLGHPQ